MSRVIGRALTKAEYVDHINGNGFDCRRSNLRIATPSQSNANRPIHSNCKSGYKGVYRRKIRGVETQQWVALIAIDRRKMYLGLFDSPAEASEAYNEAARKLHGEFATDRKASVR
jgi:hypothetical protein